jgi:hypothetical protein
MLRWKIGASEAVLISAASSFSIKIISETYGSHPFGPRLLFVA